MLHPSHAECLFILVIRVFLALKLIFSYNNIPIDYILITNFDALIIIYS